MPQNTSSEVVLTLPRTFVGQILSGLDVLAEQWEYTAETLTTAAAREDLCIRDCDSEDEARNIAHFYRDIYASIEHQLDQQSLS